MIKYDFPSKARVATAQKEPQTVDTAKIVADATAAAKSEVLAGITPLIDAATDTANNAATLAATAKNTANGAINIVTETTMTQAQKDAAQDQLVMLAGDGIAKMRTDLDKTTATADAAKTLAEKTSADFIQSELDTEENFRAIKVATDNFEATLDSLVTEGYATEV